jgi:uncharacterized protein YoaH (UPF0181 family)
MPSEEEEIINLIAQELMAGKSEATVAQELMAAGLPKREAIAIVRAVKQQLSARGMATRGRGGGRRRGGTNWLLIGLMLAMVAVLLFFALK